MRFVLPAALAVASLTACGPFVDVVDVKKAPQITRNATMRISPLPTDSCRALRQTPSDHSRGEQLPIFSDCDGENLLQLPRSSQ
jgi:hypothetical protein